MVQDLLVALLNLDAEIKYRETRLTQCGPETDEPLAPWLEDARADLLAELTLFKARREECFLELNGVRRGQSEKTGTRTGSNAGSDLRAPDASPPAFDAQGVAPHSCRLHERSDAAKQSRAGSGDRPR